jgi:peptidoglycan/LPS O-acetylase OafA/YrhL
VSGGATTRPGYRPEVDGLRAVAVLSVMLFHAGFTQVAGGYLGVDVFFVISGFLITGIIVREVEKGRFSLIGFYVRRIRRIIPALLVMCLVTTPFAAALMLPDDLENFGQSLVATALSANNILLYLTSGYFSLETLYKPLVHTWSLGVEEQYYFIVPLALAVAMKLGRRGGTLALLGVASLGSLAVAEYLRAANPEANFYLLPSRFWQLGLGGMTALALPALLRFAEPRRRLRDAAVAVALVVVIASLVLMDESMNLPGWEALAPVLATCVLLAFAEPRGPGRLLALPPMVWVGLISYSAYLYHQPVYALLRVASLDQPAPAVMAATIPPVLVLAWLSWRFVEQPFRDPARVSTAKLLLASGLGTVALVAIGWVFYATSGFYARWPELAGNDPLFGARQNMRYVEAPFQYLEKPFPPGEPAYRIVVVGNSFARDFINMGTASGRLDGFAISYWQDGTCTEWPAALRAKIAEADHVVLGSGLTTAEIPCARRRIAELERLGKRTIAVLGTKSFGFNNNAVMLIPRDRRYAYRARPLAEMVSDNRAARAAIPPRYYVDVLGLLDDGTGTVPVFTPERKFISQDRRHLTQPGARFVGEKVFSAPAFAALPPPRPADP